MNLHCYAEIQSGIYGLSAARLEGLAASALAFDADSARRAIAARPQRPGVRPPPGIAVIQVYGPLAQAPSLFLNWVGGTSTQQISAALQDAVRDPSIGQILLDVNSDGGSVYGVATLAAEIRNARSQKPVVGIANSLAASAAYWVLSQCDEIWCDPGSDIGGIGVVTSHDDVSAAMKKAGVNITLISAGKFKTEGHPYGPLDSASKGFRQQRCDEAWRAMTAGIARGRGASVEIVRSGYGQGRVVGADAAVAAGMVDGIMSYQQVIQRMVRSGRVAQPARSAAMQRNARLLGGL